MLFLTKKAIAPRLGGLIAGRTAPNTTVNISFEYPNGTSINATNVSVGSDGLVNVPASLQSGLPANLMQCIMKVFRAGMLLRLNDVSGNEGEVFHLFFQNFQNAQYRLIFDSFECSNTKPVVKEISETFVPTTQNQTIFQLANDVPVGADTRLYINGQLQQYLDDYYINNRSLEYIPTDFTLATSDVLTIYYKALVYEQA